MSIEDALQLRRVEVRRTPGIDDAYTLDEFSPSVNLIQGPNASGKSSTIRVIEAALWQARGIPGPISVVAHYLVSGNRFRVDFENGRVLVQRDGVDIDEPPHASPELRERYHLSLHDFLQGTTAKDGFAEEIARQSLGGYDLRAAAKQLGYREKPSSSRSKMLDEARAALNDARRRQEALHSDAARIAQLEKDCEEAAEARQRLQLLEKAERHARCAENESAARRELSAFPNVLAQLRGDEGETLAKLQQELASFEERRAKQVRRAEDAHETARNALPDGQVPDTLVETLRVSAADLKGSEQEVAQGERRVADLSESVKEARRSIGAVVSDAQLQAIDGVAFEELATLAQDSDRLLGSVAAADAEVVRASSGPTTLDPSEYDKILDGCSLLAQWLEEPDPLSGGTGARRRSILAVLLATTGAIGWIVLLVLGHLAAALGVLVVALAALGYFWAPSGGSGQRAARERSYRALGLAAPESWSVADVVKAFRSLRERIAELERTKQRADWLAEARRSRMALDIEVQVLERRRVELEGRLGVPSSHPVRLAYIAERVSRWADATRSLRGAEAELSRAREQLTERLQAVARLTEPLRFPRPQNSAAAEAQASDLATRVIVHRQAVATEREARESADAEERQIERLGGEVASLLARCECDSVDVDRVRQLCVERARYAESLERLRSAEQSRREASMALQSDPRYEVTYEKANVSDLARGRAEAEKRAAAYDALREELTALRTRIEDAKKETAVESALASLADVESDLRQQRARDMASMIGHLVVQHVHRETRDRHRPKVFHKARELFAAITRGRYTLEFDDGDATGENAFRAFDVTIQRGQSLDELSSATRVQLLLAVRVAFVEIQESGVRFPLFLDETLGTSDDHRARAIIDAVIALARTGRQIFYFTAQRDEIAKWTHALQERGVAHATYDLADIRRRNLPAYGSIPFEPAEVTTAVPTVPAIEGHDHASFGAAIGVPPVRLGRESSSATHLWYLIDDLAALHQLMASGVTTWGELSNLEAQGGVGLLQDHPHVFPRARALADALDVLHDQYAIGHAKPVSRAELEESGAVSDRKLDEMAALAEEVGGDALALLAKLQEKRISGFHSKKLGELRSYLDEHGFIDERPPRTWQELQSAVLSEVSGRISAGELARRDVERLLSLATGFPTSAATAPTESLGSSRLAPQVPSTETHS
jgi:energy-coupling factor transporter ATP-binding protein EcfA2